MKLSLNGLALWLLITCPAYATEPRPAIPAATETPAELALLNEPAPALHPGKQENGFLDAIAELENHYGPYNSDLPQHLMGLGVNYQNRGKHEEAAEIFRRAMHVSRISEGLYSLSQIPMLEHLIESTVAQGDWSDTNDSHKYLYWLYKRNYGDRDPRMLPAIFKLSNWHLNAYSIDSSGNTFEHLINAHNLYTMAINLISTTSGPHDLRLVEALKGLTVTNYYLATYQASSASPVGFQAGFGHGFGNSFDNSRAAMDEKDRLDQYILKSYSSGRNAIARIYEVYATNPEAPPGAEIIAQIQLADWNLLFDRRHRAMELYQAAYHSIAHSAAGPAQADEYFSRPVALPDLPLLKSSLDTTDASQEYVLVSFDVSRAGSAQNVRILESYPVNDSRNRAQVRRALKMAKFRPRFADGAPADTEQLTHRYLFAN